MDTPTHIVDANLYLKCCDLSYVADGEQWLRVIRKEPNLYLNHMYKDKEGEVQYVVLEKTYSNSNHPKELIFAFRGLLASFDPTDLIPLRQPSPTMLNRKSMLLKTQLVHPTNEVDCGGGKVHQGICEYFDRLKEDLSKYIESYDGPLALSKKDPSLSVVCTGFSMGCGLSALSALLIRKKMKERGLDFTLNLINFASPKIGDRKFANYISKSTNKYHSYYMQQDPVASYPDAEEYVLAGDQMIIKPNTYTRIINRPWQVEYHEYDSSNPPVQTLITGKQMTLSRLVNVKVDIAIPCSSVLRDCKNYHTLTSIQNAMQSIPVTSHELNRAIDDLLSKNSENEDPVDEYPKKKRWLSMFYMTCPSRYPCPVRPKLLSIPAIEQAA